MSSTVQKIRANRKVVEQNCAFCNAGFAIAEEVYQCSSCGGFHHVACWDAAGSCPYPASATAAFSGSPTQSNLVETAAWTSPPISNPPVGSNESTTPYSAWSTEQLEEALTANRASYLPAIISLMEAEWQGRNQPPLRPCASCGGVNKSLAGFCSHCGLRLEVLPVTPVYAPVAPAYAPTANTAQMVAIPRVFAPDERACPACAEVIKKEAVKCRFCGHLFDSRYGTQERGGFFGDTERMMVEDEIRSDAKSALTMSIIGLFCLGIILEPIAIYKASRALSKLGKAEREYPNLDAGSARGQAIAALVIGIIILLISVIYVIGVATSGPTRYR